jgi:hypothetical protein
MREHADLVIGDVPQVSGSRDCRARVAREAEAIST